jgi:hypothetical protein
MDYLPLFPPYNRSSDAIELPGITTRYNCKDLLQRSVAYIALFAVYIDRGYTPQQFFGLLSTPDVDKHFSEMFETEFGSLRNISLGGKCCVSRYIK